jgi:hypothetical protein
MKPPRPQLQRIESGSSASLGHFDDPEMGYTRDSIPMHELGPVDSSDDEHRDTGIDRLGYSPSTRKSYGSGLGRHRPAKVGPTGLSSAMKRSNTFREATSIMRNVSRRVAAVHPEGNSDDELRPLRLSDTGDVQTEPDETSSGSDLEDKDKSSNLNFRTSTKHTLVEPATQATPSFVNSAPQQATVPSPQEDPHWPLKGKSLGIFGPKNGLRVAMYNIMKSP